MPAKLSTISGVRRGVEPELPVEELDLDQQDVTTPEPAFDHTTIAEAPSYVPMTMNELVAFLASPLDPSVIKERDGFFGEKIKYLDGKYVINTLNRAFGYGNWEYYAQEVKDMTIDAETGIPMGVSAMVCLTVRFPNGREVEFTDTGFGETPHPWDKVNKVYKPRTWGGYEIARKGAVTDGLKRCAANLGDQFGLSLKGKETPEHQASSGGAAPTAPRSATAAPASSDTYYQCEDPDCDKEIKGYTAKSGRVYTTEELVNYSKKDCDGHVFCYDHKQAYLNAYKR